MSLLVWLPLNGNLENRGLSPAKFNIVNTSGGLTIASGGKTSQKMYKRQTRNTIDYIISDQNFTLAGDVSMCCWAKVTGIGDSATANGIITQHGHLTGGLGITMKDVSSTDLRMSVNTGLYGDNGSSDRTYCTYYGNTNIYNQWHHLCLTYQSSTKQLRMYVDGKLDRSVITLAGNSAVARPFALFAWSTDHLTSNSYRPPCELNDVRLYDHCLSIKEIKEISKGLAAHYQLKGMGRTNYLKGGGQFTRENPLIRKSSDVSHMNDSYVYHNGVLSVTVPTDDTYTWILDCDGVPSGHNTSGTVATSRYFSMWLQNTSTGNHYCWSNYGTGEDGKKYGSVSIPAGTYNVRTNLYAADNVNYTLKMWNIKLVQGSYKPNDTYCPNEGDTLYKALGLAENIEPNVSGLSAAGTKKGTFTVREGSPRNSTCYTFNGSSYIACGRDPMVSDAITVSCWGYMDNWSDYTSRRLISCTEGGGWNLEPSGENSANGMCFAVGTGTTTNSYHNAVSSIPCSDMNPGWHMFTGTYDGYTTKIYVDGVLRGSSATKSSKTPIFYNSSNGIFIGAEAAGSSATPGGQYFNGKISDVRIYGTALSASDIEELYNTPASLSKDGTLFAHDFHENLKNSIGKDGVIASNNFGNKKAPIHDMKIKALGDGSVWARIHHLDVTHDKNWFTTAEVTKSTTPNRYSRMGIVEKFYNGTDYEFMLTYPSMKRTVPAGYTKLEYIEATGTQWINTGVTGGARWEFDIQFTKTDERKLMGYGGDGAEYWGCQINGRYGVFTDSVIGYAGNRDIIVHDYTTTGGGTLWVENSTLSLGATDVSSKQYQIFTIVSSTGWACSAKLWRCRCIQNNTLIRDFVPAQRNSDGAIGLIDIVNNVFYGNSGSGTFAAGYKNIYQWLDYIESTGTQYINTGFKPDSNSRIVIKALNSSYYSVYGTNYSGAAFNLTASSSNGGVVYFYWGGAGASTMTNYINQVHTFEQNKNVCYVDGATYHTYTNSSWSCPVPIFLFARTANGSSANDIGGTVRIYSCQLYNNGTLMRDFIPCVNPNGEVGMFDKVTGGFFGNSGTGSFVAGPTREPLPLYNRWIQTSSPNATVASGFKPLETSWTGHHAGLRKNGSACVYNCDTGGTWYTPIGQTATWTDTQYIPAADGSSQTETELWVRIDRLGDETQFKIYNKFMMAPNYIEL